MGTESTVRAYSTQIGLNEKYRNLTSQYGFFEFKGLNFLNKNDSNHKQENLEPPRGPNLSMKKINFRALKRAIKVHLLWIFCCYYTDRVTKTLRIRTEELIFAD